MNLSHQSILRPLRIIAFLALMLFLILQFFFPIETEDVWWHLATGRWIVNHHAVPQEDVFSFTTERTSWTYMQWLGSILFYQIYQSGGLWGLKIFRSLFISLCLLLPFLYARSRLAFVWRILLCFFLAEFLHARIVLRPQMFNFLFIQLALIILFHYRRHRQPRILIFLPLLGILWSNIHLGCLVYGFVIIAIFFFAAVIDYLNHRLALRVSGPPAASQLLRRIWDLALASIGYLAGFLVNPYGWKGFFYHFRVFLDPTFINFYKFNHIIFEVQAPVEIFSGTGWFLILFFLLAVVLIFKKRRDWLLHILLLCVSFFMFLHGRRALDFFLFVASYVIIECLPKDGLVLKPKWKKILPWLNIAAILVLTIFMLSQAFVLGTRRIFAGNRFTPVLALSISPNNPFSILRELSKSNVQGGIFTNDYQGGAVLFAAYPDLRPLTDGRQIDQELYSEYYAISSDPERNWPVLAPERHLNLVLLDTLVPFSYRLLTYLSQNPDWQLARVHGSLVLFVKKSDIDLSASWKNFATELSSTPLTPSDVEALRLYLETSEPKTSPFDAKTVYIEPLEEAANLIGLGYQGLGVKRLLALSKEIDYPNIRAVARSALFLIETAAKEKASAQDQQSN